MFDFKGVETAYWKVLVVAAIAIAVIGALCFTVTFVQKKRQNATKFSTRDLTYGSVCIAIAYVLSFFGFTMPQGGTITPFSILPIIIYCYYFGFAKGSIVCTIYMVLQLLQKPYIVSPYSALLDYVIPYLALCCCGIFAYSTKRYNKVTAEKRHILFAHYPVFIGAVMYALIRYASHVLSGVIFFGEWAWTGYSALGYSLVYNSFALVDFTIALTGLVALLCSKTFNTFMASNRNTLQDTRSRAKDN